MQSKLQYLDANDYVYVRIKAVAVNRYSNNGLLAGGLGLATRAD